MQGYYVFTSYRDSQWKQIMCYLHTQTNQQKNCCNCLLTNNPGNYCFRLYTLTNHERTSFACIHRPLLWQELLCLVAYTDQLYTELLCLPACTIQLVSTTYKSCKDVRVTEVASYTGTSYMDIVCLYHIQPNHRRMWWARLTHIVPS